MRYFFDENGGMVEKRFAKSYIDFEKINEHKESSSHDLVMIKNHYVEFSINKKDISDYKSVVVKLKNYAGVGDIYEFCNIQCCTQSDLVYSLSSLGLLDGLKIPIRQ